MSIYLTWNANYAPTANNLERLHTFMSVWNDDGEKKEKKKKKKRKKRKKIEKVEMKREKKKRKEKGNSIQFMFFRVR